MDKDYTFIIIGLQPWYTSIGSNCKQIAKELSENFNVLYINAPLDRRSVLKKKDHNIVRHLELTKNGKGHINHIEGNLWEYYPARVLESINWIPFTYLFQKVNYYNNKLFAADIKEAMDLLKIKDFYLFNDNEIFRAFYLKELLKPKAYIYYCRDYMLGVDYWKKHGEKLEPLHIQKSDYAMANSAYLTEYLAQYNENAIDVGQGCNTTLFNAETQQNVPKDLSDIKGIKIGYVGALNSLRLDLDGIISIAKSNPQWQVILVGPEDEDFTNSELHKLGNVHFLGQKELSDLPKYIAGFDVCINPQKVNMVTIGNYPLKIDEYLNMGKPVVATKTKAMKIFDQYVYLAESCKDYPKLIALALDEDSENKREERIQFASQHTWQNSVGKILDALNLS